MLVVFAKHRRINKGIFPKIKIQKKMPLYNHLCGIVIYLQSWYESRVFIEN